MKKIFGVICVHDNTLTTEISEAKQHRVPVGIDKEDSMVFRESKDQCTGDERRVHREAS